MCDEIGYEIQPENLYNLAQRLLTCPPDSAAMMSGKAMMMTAAS
ncbi:hypothetical protein [Mucilaginibacter aurantiaciroseus]|nr:hypothetical protein [Mucilaginibacter aurantiaciroseus]